MTHHWSLTERNFEDVYQGRKTVEFRLLDRKRQLATIGDTICFHELGSTQRIKVKIADTLTASTFRKLLMNIDAKRIEGWTGKQSLLDMILQCYPIAEHRAQFTKVAFYFDVLKGEPGERERKKRERDKAVKHEAIRALYKKNSIGIAKRQKAQRHAEKMIIEGYEK